MVQLSKCVREFRYVLGKFGFGICEIVMYKVHVIVPVLVRIKGLSDYIVCYTRYAALWYWA